MKNESKSKNIQEIGQCLSGLILENRSDKAQFFYKLYKYFPNMERPIEWLVDRSLPVFKVEPNEIPLIVKERFSIKYREKHLICDDLLIVDNRFCDYSKKEFRSFIAFDLKTKEFLWEFSVDYKELTHCQLNPFGFVVVYKDDPIVYVYDKNTGKEVLRGSPLNIEAECFISLHVTSDGFCYYFARHNKKRTLFGVDISGGEWKQVFEISGLKNGWLQPAGNYVKIQEPHTPFLVLGQDGSRVELDCKDFIIQNNVLYTSKTLVKNESSIVSMQSIKAGSAFELEDDKVEFECKGSYVCFTAICPDGTIICYEDYPARRPIFIDTKTRQVIESETVIPEFSCKLEDPNTASIWYYLGESFHDDYKHIKKITKAGCEDLGCTEKYFNLSLSHFADDGKLCLLDFNRL